jgi:hypothetical protein
MGIFWNTSKPNVSEKEFSRMIGELMSKGFTKNEVNKIHEIFRGDLYEGNSSQKGIDRDEVNRAISWMRANTSRHGFSEERIATIEKELVERI